VRVSVRVRVYMRESVMSHVWMRSFTWDWYIYFIYHYAYAHKYIYIYMYMYIRTYSISQTYNAWCRVLHMRYSVYQQMSHIYPQMSYIYLRTSDHNRFDSLRLFLIVLPVYVSIYVCAWMRHTYIHMHLQTYTQTYINTYIITDIHTYIHTKIHTYKHTKIHTYIHKYIHTCIHTYIQTNIHTYIHTYTHTYIQTYIHTYMQICTYTHTLLDTMNHVKIIKGQPRWFALVELVPSWYNTFPPDHIDQLEINNSTMLRNKTSTA